MLNKIAVKGGDLGIYLRYSDVRFVDNDDQ